MTEPVLQLGKRLNDGAELCAGLIRTNGTLRGAKLGNGPFDGLSLGIDDGTSASAWKEAQ